MPKIEKGVRLTDAQKRKINKLKSEGATKGEMASIRMSLLRGATFPKAMKKLEERRGAVVAVPKTPKSVVAKPTIVEDKTAVVGSKE